MTDLNLKIKMTEDSKKFTLLIIPSKTAHALKKSIKFYS